MLYSLLISLLTLADRFSISSDLPFSVDHVGSHIKVKGERKLQNNWEMDFCKSQIFIFKE